MADRKRLDVLFDLRAIIALLFGVYGLICLVWGLAFNGPTDRARSGNINVNLWAGIGMLVFAAGFAAWTLVRPLVPAETETETDPDGAPPEHD